MKIVMLTPTQMLNLTSDDGTYSITKKNLLKKLYSTIKWVYFISIMKTIVKHLCIYRRQKNYSSMQLVVEKPLIVSLSHQHCKIKPVPIKDYGNLKNHQIIWKLSSITWILTLIMDHNYKYKHKIPILIPNFIKWQAYLSTKDSLLLSITYNSQLLVLKQKNIKLH